MSELRTNRIVPRDGLPSGSSGGIIQVKSTTKTTQQEVLDSSGSSVYPSGAVDIMTVTITPTRADSKILVSSTVQAACSDAAILYMFRDSNLINAGTDGSSGANGAYRGWAHVRMGPSNETYSYTTQFLDSPGDTSSHTYKIKGLNMNGSYTLYINRRASNDTYALTSFLTVMEISG
tara:strand:+ start:176 stop:706 length:531 start_codon:yes stop_codon:yes gene_type:complete